MRDKSNLLFFISNFNAKAYEVADTIESTNPVDIYMNKNVVHVYQLAFAKAHEKYHHVENRHN